MKDLEPITFKFRWLDANGNEAGFFGRRQGSFDGEILRLDETEVPADSILALSVREKFMFVAIEDEALTQLVFSIYGIDPNQLRQAVDGSRSDMRAIKEKEALNAKGEGGSYRQEICSHCGATIMLTNLPRTPQCYCEYCETLFTIDNRSNNLGVVAQQTLTFEQEKKYKNCDECGMYSEPQKFTIFYFYFLLYVFGWSSRKTFRCPACMRGDAWKMLFVNIFGFLGLPIAIIQLIRCYRAKASKGPLKGLDDANILANRGKIDRALGRYDQLMDSLPNNAGIKFNIGSGLVRKKDFASAETMFQLSLEDCANYGPSVEGLTQCYVEQEKIEELAHLLHLHGDGASLAEQHDES